MRGARPAEDGLSHLTKSQRFYRSLRVDVSLLLSEGHHHARRYPLIVLWQEAQVVRERVNSRIVTDATMIDSAIAANLNKPARKQFIKTLKDLSNG